MWQYRKTINFAVMCDVFFDVPIIEICSGDIHLKQFCQKDGQRSSATVDTENKTQKKPSLNVKMPHVTSIHLRIAAKYSFLF